MNFYSSKAAAISALVLGLPGLAKASQPLAVVRHLTRVKIIDSNNVSLRPGSIYDNVTYFESLPGLKPNFNYEFVDTGLGTADPLYPNYQKGHQGSWAQIIPAFFSEQNRHIDHFTSLPTPEGCLVDGLYMLRNINEFPKILYQRERNEGYDLIVIRLEYYTRLRSDAECGRHRTNAPDPNFDPMKFMQAHLDAMTLEDFPQEKLARFEAKTSAIRHISQEMNRSKWPRFDLENLKHNSLWYYPEGYAEDYGINAPRTLNKWKWVSQPKHLVVTPDASVRANFPLHSLLKSEDFGKVLDFLNGKPTPDFDPSTEPGHDTLRLSDVTAKNIYTSGLEMEPIRDVKGDVSRPEHYALVGMNIKPFDIAYDSLFPGGRIVPQLRFVYQLMNPRNPTRPLEQLYLHLKFDVIDRLASQTDRDTQHAHFLDRVDELTKAQETHDAHYSQILASFVEEFTGRPLEAVSFSSSLTGIWVFGELTRTNNAKRELKPLRIVRDGVDIGYYSSAFDNDIFREEIKKSSGERKVLLEKHMEDITVAYYRDPKRMDPHALNFDRVTCAQCHQMSGRDAVHMAINDGLDRRLKMPARVSEFVYHEADRELELAQKFFNSAR